jgi:integrase
VEAVNSELWERWHTFAKGQVAMRDDDPKTGWSSAYASKVFALARSFIKWLYEHEYLDAMPRNLTSKRYRFARPDDAIPTFTVAEVKHLLDNAGSPLRCYLTLMLNTGMTQKDLSDLRHDQVDLVNGTVCRRRSKTSRLSNTPKVCYKLWPVTLELLKANLSQDPVFALLSKDGRRLVYKVYQDDGKLRQYDAPAVAFHLLRRRLKLTGKGKSLKVFRKTSATTLKAHAVYRSLVPYFLGHSAKSMADRHYAAESQTLLDEAVTWLGQQFGLA